MYRTYYLIQIRCNPVEFRMMILFLVVALLCAMETACVEMMTNVDYEYNGVIGNDYNDWNRTIQEIIALLPGYNCTGDPQWPYGEVQNFPCQILPPSEAVPNSVHKLRPADINVIGAIGDSLSAANGAGACSVPQVLQQYRGMTFSHGGDGSYETVPTLANILRKYNSNLKGYGKETGIWSSENAGMNVAIPGAVAHEIPEQAENLVQKMKDDPSIDFDKDWKLITIFIGGNDLCAVCENESKYSPAAYVGNIHSTIQVLHDQMPRTLVNVVGILDLRELNLLPGVACAVSHRVFCSCVSNATESELQNKWLPTLLEYQNRLEEMVTSGIYDDKEDFSVVHQPFFHNTKLPLIEGVGDVSYMAPDCFHFSAKGHAETANALWNNMVQPVGTKNRAWVLGGPFTCPTQESPYLYTNVNSRQQDDMTTQPTSSTSGYEQIATTVESIEQGEGSAMGLVGPLQTICLLVLLSSSLPFLSIC